MNDLRTPLEPYDVAKIREDFPILTERPYGRPLVYLDNAASAQKPKAVIDRLVHAYEHEYANVHRGEIASRESALAFAKSDFQRGQELMKTGFITKQAFEQRKRNYDAAAAAVKSFTSQRDQALSQIANSEAEVDRIQSIIDDLTLVSPRLGRVQYQLARAGEVVAAGAPIVTILDLTDVYMTIFLPAADAAVFPGHISVQTGRPSPSSSTARIIWLRSGRWSLEKPRRPSVWPPAPPDLIRT